MSTYVISDIHGQYKAYKKMLREIDFKPEDTLYVLGDAIDRGPNGIKVLITELTICHFINFGHTLNNNLYPRTINEKFDSFLFIFIVLLIIFALNIKQSFVFFSKSH